jgi:hypothetical protein
MNNFLVAICVDKEEQRFEVGEYLHHSGETCKFKVFKDGTWVASFEPDPHEYLRVYNNPGNLKEDVLHLLADEIENHHPHQMNYNIKTIKP